MVHCVHFRDSLYVFMLIYSLPWLRYIPQRVSMDTTQMQIFNLRLPLERLVWLKTRAKANHRSVTAELNHIIDTLQQEESKAVQQTAQVSVPIYRKF